MRFVVRSVSVEKDLKGQEMRRVLLTAVAGEPFKSDAEIVPAGGHPDPEGTMSILVNRSFAKRFQPGDEFDVSFRERERE